MNKQQIKDKIEKLQNQLKEIELKEKQKLDKPLIIKTKTHEFQIHKWEDKPVKDFPMPKGFELAEERDFVDLYDNDLIELEKYPVVYFTKNRSKKNKKIDWGLSRWFLGRNLYLDSGNGDVANSGDDGRVVICRSLK